MSTERPGNVLPEIDEELIAQGDQTGPGAPKNTGSAVRSGGPIEGEAAEFVRFCYRRRAVAWPELYDEMCAVAARAEFRGMTYEHLERAGIGLALYALPALAALVARVIAEERGDRVGVPIYAAAG